MDSVETALSVVLLIMVFSAAVELAIRVILSRDVSFLPRGAIPTVNAMSMVFSVLKPAMMTASVHVVRNAPWENVEWHAIQERVQLVNFAMAGLALLAVVPILIAPMIKHVSPVSAKIPVHEMDRVEGMLCAEFLIIESSVSAQMASMGNHQGSVPNSNALLMQTVKLTKNAEQDRVGIPVSSKAHVESMLSVVWLTRELSARVHPDLWAIPRLSVNNCRRARACAIRVGRTRCVTNCTAGMSVAVSRDVRVIRVRNASVRVKLSMYVPIKHAVSMQRAVYEMPTLPSATVHQSSLQGIPTLNVEMTTKSL